MITLRRRKPHRLLNAALSCKTISTELIKTEQILMEEVKLSRGGVELLKSTDWFFVDIETGSNSAESLYLTIWKLEIGLVDSFLPVVKKKKKNDKSKYWLSLLIWPPPTFLRPCNLDYAFASEKQDVNIPSIPTTNLLLRETFAVFNRLFQTWSHGPSVDFNR